MLEVLARLRLRDVCYVVAGEAKWRKPCEAK